MAPYQSLKLFLVNASGLSKPWFHFLLGISIYFLVAKLFRVRLSSWKALIAPLVLALLMEAMDLRDSTVYQARYDWVDSVRDLVVTMSGPLVAWLVARLSRKQA